MAKQPKKEGFSIQGFDAQAYKQTEAYVQAIDALYNQAIMEFAQLATQAKVNQDKPFAFKDYPATQAKVQQIVNALAAKMQAVITKGSREQWLYACKKNDDFIASILNTSKINPKKLQKMQDRNLEALKTFQGRKVNGMDLSQRVWKYTGQLKTTMELGIDVALGKGTSAAQLSRELRKYLQEPDNLFRKVKDKHGNLTLSKAAKALHPGQGVYRSSYKNAMRLTRSEINLAYKEADQLRWQQLDFVVGYEIKLSNNHTLNGEPFVDICDKLAGKYPKSFKFKGWHPQCRCTVVPILQSREEFNDDELADLKSALNGKEYQKYSSKETVTDVPDNFKEWIQENAERSRNWASQPYFVRDNFKGGTIGGGLDLQQAVLNVKPVKIKPVKTEQQKADIQQRWNTRVASRRFGQEVETIAEQYKSVDSINAFANSLKTAIKEGQPIETISKMVNKLKHKVEVKKVWDENKEFRKLDALLVGSKAAVAKFGKEAVQGVYDAVEAKIDSWSLMIPETQKKKLLFEIDWVEKNKKYDTWEVAQAAYKKKLVQVEYLIEKQSLINTVEHSLGFAETTKSKVIKNLATEVNNMISKEVSLSAFKQKIKELNTKVEKVIKSEAIKQGKKLAKAGSDVDWTDQSAYVKARKDAAMWAKDPAYADPKVRDMAGYAWRAASDGEKTAAYRYTSGSSYINEPLRSQHYSGQYLGKYDGKVDADHLTKIVGRSSYDFDIWLQRGVDGSSVRGMFGKDIDGMTVTQARSALVGKEGVEPGFSSCANSKGAGFSSRSIIYNIYCPKGTKMLYAEPFSGFGNGAGRSWDGISKQVHFGYEAEMILQRSTKFRILKVEKSGSKWYIDMEVIGQL